MFSVKYLSRPLWRFQIAPGSARVLPAPPASVPSPPPKSCPPTATVIQRLLFFPRVCSMCAVSSGGGTRPHGAPDRVDTVACPEARQQALKRGAVETDRAPGTDLLPC